MARYEHLPIYKAAMDLTVYIETIVRNFSRYHTYTLGTGLCGSRGLATQEGRITKGRFGTIE